MSADPSPAAVHDRVKLSYEAYHEAVARTPYADQVRFMNYGYAPGPGDGPTAGAGATPTVHVPRLLPNRHAALLVRELVAAEPLAGRRVVDVGCGRGGTAWLLAAHGGAGWVCGVDLAIGAVRAATRLSRHGSVAFTQGDAEALPFAAGSVDVVTNVESSLHYPDLAAFYREAARVLVRGGAFLTTDVYWSAAGSAYQHAMADAGFDLEDVEDITANVLDARAARAAREAEALGHGGAAPESAARFAGVAGTAFTSGLSDGTWRYLIHRARRSSRAPAAVAPPDPRLAAAAAAAHHALGEFA